MSKKILIIDEDRDILELITFILEEKGFEVIASLSGNILDDVLEINPDLILLDDWLADLNGHKLCSILKTTPITKHIPVILISASMGLEQLSQDCFADSYIEKPFDIDLLELKIHAQLDSYF